MTVCLASEMSSLLLFYWWSVVVLFLVIYCSALALFLWLCILPCIDTTGIQQNRTEHSAHLGTVASSVGHNFQILLRRSCCMIGSIIFYSKGITKHRLINKSQIFREYWTVGKIQVLLFWQWMPTFGWPRSLGYFGKLQKLLSEEARLHSIQLQKHHQRLHTKGLQSTCSSSNQQQ